MMFCYFDNWCARGVARIKGVPDARPYLMRFLGADDLDDIVNMHQLVVSALPHPHVFRQDTRAFIEQHLGKRGWTVGVFVCGRLIAYAAISFPDGEADNLGSDLPLPEAELRYVAHYDGSAVHPDYRGNRFQQMMTDARHQCALLHGRYHILGTVSPLNPASLRNFLEMGCRVRNLKTKYGGMLRLIIHRDLRQVVPVAYEGSSAVDVPLEDILQLTALLNEGLEGSQVVLVDATACLRMARPQRFDLEPVANGLVHA